MTTPGAWGPETLHVRAKVHAVFAYYRHCFECRRLRAARRWKAPV